jgi:ABC-2 type transport system permease protein
METNTSTHKSESLRIIWAITQKDLLDAFRSRTILTIFLTGIFLVALYNFLPAISKSNEKPVLAVLSNGNKHLTEELEASQEFTARPFDQREAYETFLGSEDHKVMGILLPDNFDEIRQEQDHLVLQGHVDHWLSSKKLEELQVFFEDQLTLIFLKPVQLEIEKKIFTNTSAFFIFNHGLALAIILMLMGTLITPNIIMEEKQRKTMDALLVSPANPVMIVISKALTSLIFCLTGTLLALIIYGRFIVNWDILIAAFILGALFFVSLGLLTGVMLSNPNQVAILFVIVQPLVIPMALSFADGVFPPVVDQIIDWTPTGALIDAFKTAMVVDVPGDIMQKLVIVLAYTLVLLALVVWKLSRSDR